MDLESTIVCRSRLIFLIFFFVSWTPCAAAGSGVFFFPVFVFFCMYSFGTSFCFCFNIFSVGTWVPPIHSKEKKRDPGQWENRRRWPRSMGSTNTQRYYRGGSKLLFIGGLTNRLWLVAFGNKFFHRRVTENRLWKCISTGGSAMPTAGRNLFSENMKSVFKNRKKRF